jgi:GH35 family endo-1,4-beta-xylanase
MRKLDMNKVNHYLQYEDRVMSNNEETCEIYQFTARITYDCTELDNNIYTYVTEDYKHTYTLTESDIMNIAIAINDLEDNLEIFTVMSNMLTEILDREFAIIREYDNNNVIRLNDYKIKKIIRLINYGR